MKGKDWVEAAVVFYEHWFSVTDSVREKLVEKVLEFEAFAKNVGELNEESARIYKKLIVTKVKTQCQDSEDFVTGLFGDWFLQILCQSAIKPLDLVKTETAVEELLKQGFTHAQVIEIVTRGEGCDSEKVAGILLELSKSENHHSCSDHKEDEAASMDLFKQILGASEEDQNDVLIALLKRKGLPIATITVLTGWSEEQIKASNGFAV